MIPYKKTQLIEYLKTRFLDLHKLDIELLEKKIYRKTGHTVHFCF